MADPDPLIGPNAVVPIPTDTTFIYSSSTLTISFEVIVAIPATSNIVLLVEIWAPLLVNVVLTGVNAIGDCIIPSIDISAFSFFKSISNSWTFPLPRLKNVTPVPAFAFAADVANLNWSLLVLIANTSSGKSVPETCCIAVLPIPVKVDLGV